MANRVYEFDIKANADQAIAACEKLDGVMAKLADKRLKLIVDTDKANLRDVENTVKKIADDIPIDLSIDAKKFRIKGLEDKRSELQDLLKFNRNNNPLGLASWIEKEMEEMQDAIDNGIDVSKLHQRMKRVIDIAPYAGMLDDKDFVDFRKQFPLLDDYKPNPAVFKEIQKESREITNNVGRLKNELQQLEKSKELDSALGNDKKAEKQAKAAEDAANAEKERAKAANDAADAEERKAKAANDAEQSQKESTKSSKDKADSKANESAKNTAKSTEKESESASDAAESFERAAAAKEAFAKANEKAAETAEETTKKTTDEGDAAEKTAEKMADAAQQEQAQTHKPDDDDYYEKLYDQIYEDAEASERLFDAQQEYANKAGSATSAIDDITSAYERQTDAMLKAKDVSEKINKPEKAQKPEESEAVKQQEKLKESIEKTTEAYKEQSEAIAVQPKKKTDYEKAAENMNNRMSILNKNQAKFVSGMLDMASGDTVLADTERAVKRMQTAYKSANDVADKYRKKHPEDKEGANALRKQNTDMARATNEKFIQQLENRARKVKTDLEAIVGNPEKYSEAFRKQAQNQLDALDQMSDYIGKLDKSKVFGVAQLKDALSFLKGGEDVVSAKGNKENSARYIPEEVQKQRDDLKALNSEIEKFNNNQESAIEKSFKDIGKNNAYDVIKDSVAEANQEFDKLEKKQQDYYDANGGKNNAPISIAEDVAKARKSQYDAFSKQLSSSADDLISKLESAKTSGPHTSAFIAEIDDQISKLRGIKDSVEKITADDFFNKADIQDGFAEIIENAKTTLGKVKDEFKDSDMSRDYNDALKAIKNFKKADIDRYVALSNQKEKSGLSIFEEQELNGLEARLDRAVDLTRTFFKTYRGESSASDMFRDLKSNLGSLSDSIDDVTNKSKFKDLTNDVKDFVKDLDKIKIKDILDGLTDGSYDSNSIIQQFEEILDKVQKFKDSIKDTASKTMFDDIDEAVNKLSDSGVEKIGDLVKSRIEAINNTLKSDGGKYKLTDDAREGLTKLRIELEGLLSDSKNIKFGDLIGENASEAASKIDDFCDSLKKADDKMVDFAQDSSKVATNESISKWIDKASGLLNYKINGSQKESLLSYIKELEAGLGDGKFGSIALDRMGELRTAIIQIGGDLEKSGGKARSFFQQFSGAITSQSAQFLARYFSFQDMIRYGRELISTVNEIDASMTELAKVSNASDTRLEQSFKRSTETAQEMGSTITDVINSTADWSRIGYSVDDAEELARITTLFQTVGDNMTQETASQSMVSTLKGFQMDASEAIDIVDKFNEVANNYSIDTEGIGVALQKSAAAFNASGTSLDKALALIVATNDVLQNPQTTGTLWNTLSARIRGASLELADMNEETDEYVTSTSKLRDLVKGATGFDIMKEDGKTYKDLYDIVLGIGKEWNKLDDVTQSGLAEALAGKRNARGLYSTFSNMKDLEDAYQSALNSSGSAMREQEHYAQSVQYSIDQTKASLQELSYNFLSSDLLKGAVDAANAILQAVNGIVSALGSPGAIASSVLLIDGLKSLLGGGGIIDTVGTALMVSKGIQQGPNFLGTVMNGFKSFSEKDWEDTAKAGNAIGETLSENAGKAMSETMGDVVSDSVGEAVGEMAGEVGGNQLGKIIQFPAAKKDIVKDAAELGKEAGDAVVDSTQETVEKAVKRTSFASKLASNIVPILGGVAIAGLAYAAYKSAVEQQRQERITTAKNELSTWAADDKAIDNYIERIQTLRTELDSGTASDARQLELKQQIYGIQQEIVSTYGAQAQGLDLINGELEQQLNYVKQISSESANRMLSENAVEFSELDKNIQKTYSRHAAGGIVISEDKNDINRVVADQIESIIKENGYNTITPISSFYGGTETIDYKIEGNAKDVTHDVEGLNEQLRDLQSSYVFENNTEAAKILGNVINALADGSKEITSDYKSMAPTIEEESEAIYNAQKGSYEITKSLKSAMDDLNNAMTNGSIGEIASAYDNYIQERDKYYDFVSGIDKNVYPAYDPDLYFNKMTAGFDEVVVKTMDFNSALKDGKTIIEDSPFEDSASDLKNMGDAIKELQLDSVDARQLLDADGLKGAAADYQKILRTIAQNYLKNFGYDLDDNSNNARQALDKFFNYMTQEGYFVGEAGDKIKSVTADFNTFRNQAVNAIAGVETLNSAIVSSLGSKGVSYSFDENGEITGNLGTLLNAYKDLEGFNAAELFTRTAHGIQINTKSLRKLQAQQKAVMKQGFLDQQKRLTDELTQALIANDQARRKGQEQPFSDNTIQQLRDYIEETYRLAGAYDGVTSRYQEWLDSQQVAKPGDMYEAMRTTGLEHMQAIVNEGNWGDPELRALLQFFTGKDLSTASFEELGETYASLNNTIADTPYDVLDFYAEGTKGIDNFMDALLRTGHAIQNVDGEIEALGPINTKELAEEWGIGDEAIDLLLDFMRLKGVDLTRMSEDQAEAIDNINSKLAETKENLSVKNERGNAISDYLGLSDPSTLDSLESVNEEIEKISKFRNQGTAGEFTADQMHDLDEYYNQLIQKRRVLQSMSGEQALIDEKSIGNAIDAVETLRERVSTLQQKELQTGIPMDVTGDKEAMAAIKEIADSDPEIKAHIGLDRDATEESIAEGVNSGKIDLEELYKNLTNEQLEKTLGEQISEQLNGKDGEGVEVKVKANTEAFTEAMEAIKEQYKEIEVDVVPKDSEESKKPSNGKNAHDVVRDGSDLRNGANVKPYDEYAVEDSHLILSRSKSEIKDTEEALKIIGENANAAGIALKGLAEPLSEGRRAQLEDSKQKTAAKYTERQQKNEGVVDNKHEVVNESGGFKPSFEIVKKATDYTQNAFGSKVAANVKRAVKAIAPAVDNSQTAFQESTPNIIDAIEAVSDVSKNVGANIGKGMSSTLRNQTENVTENTTVNRVKTVFESVGATAGAGIQDGVQHIRQEVDQANLDTTFEGTMHITPEVEQPPNPDDGQQHIDRDYDPPETVVANASQGVDRYISTDVSTTAPTAIQGVIRTIIQDVPTTVASAVQNVIRVVSGAIGASYRGTVTNSGGAFARGSISSVNSNLLNDKQNQTKKKETALTGELGRELVVYGNQWWTVGDHGAEFANIPKGAVIFDAEQTEQLLNKGRTSGRGRAYLSGSQAYAGGSVWSNIKWKPGGYDYATPATSTPASSYDGGGAPTYSDDGVSNAESVADSTSDAAEAADDFKETLDEIEILLDRVDREIEHIDRTAQGAYNTFTSRNSAISKELGVITTQINNQMDGYKRYIEQANSVGLDDVWAQKVRDGAINIEEVTDEDLWDKIQEYQEWLILSHLAQQCVMTILLNCWETLRATTLQRRDEICSCVIG